jgi:flagellar biosynthesis protein FlhF
METFVEQGESRRECLSKIVAKYGERIAILRERKVSMGGFLGFFTREGVEIEFYFPPVLSRSVSWQSGQSAVPSQQPLDFQKAKDQVLAAAGKDPARIAAQVSAQAEKETADRLILDELQAIKAKIDSTGGKPVSHPSLVRAADMLRLNDFSESYITRILVRARQELSLEALDDFDAVQNRLLDWIGESISIYTPQAVSRPGGKIMVFVGPTGVGKTTTIAKLAAIFGVSNSGRPPMPVRLITIDAYRIGAREQLEAYGKIMELPFVYVGSRRDLKKEIALHGDKSGLILVDTIGKSPRDSAKLGEMKELLDACGSRAEVHLVLSACTKTSDIEEILRQFEPFNYRSVLLTKLDETRHIGNVISVLSERGKPVSWITDGQKVPNDIKKAGVVRFLTNLDDFKVDRDAIEKRFPDSEADQVQWS